MSFLKKILGSAIEEGINEFTEYLKDKQDDDYYINLGYRYSSLGDTSKAIKCYKKAIEKDPTSNIAYFSIGLEYYFLEEYIEAAESFQRSIEIDPKFVFAYNGLAMGYM